MPAKHQKFVSLVVKTFTVSLILIVGLLAADYHILTARFQSQEGNSVFVEVSGRQRMLVQRIALLALGMTSAGDPALRARFQDEISQQLERMQVAHRALTEGDKELNLSPSAAAQNLPGKIHNLFYHPEHNLHNRMLDFFNAISNFLSSAEETLTVENSDLEHITLASTSLLEDLRILTEYYRERSEHGIESLHRTKLLLFVGTLLVLGSIVLFIFIPLLKNLKQEFQRRELAESKLMASARSLEQRTVELQRSNSELEQFAGMVAHDLKGPLTNVQAFLEIMTEAGGQKFRHAYQEPILHIELATSRMQTMITDLLAYSKVAAHGRELDVVDLNRIVSAIAQDLSATIQKQKATLMIEELPSIQADATQMYQLFQNLIGNSLKFKKDSEDLEIKISGTTRATTEQSDEVIISVEDNGVGFDSDIYAERAFQIFHRLHGSEYEGSGVGLSICQKIVRRHNGSIAVQSAPGEGARFEIKLPLRQPSAA